MKTQPKLIVFTETQLQMVEEVKERTGFNSLAEVIRMGLVELHKSYYPSYKTSPNVGGKMSDETMVQQEKRRAIAKQVGKKTAEELKYAKKIEMCENLLGGKVLENPNGSKVCSFKQYSMTGDKEQVIPLSQVDPIIAETSLFVPSKEAIFRSRPEVKKLFYDESEVANPQS